MWGKLDHHNISKFHNPLCHAIARIPRSHRCSNYPGGFQGSSLQGSSFRLWWKILNVGHPIFVKFLCRQFSKLLSILLLGSCQSIQEIFSRESTFTSSVEQVKFSTRKRRSKFLRKYADLNDNKKEPQLSDIVELFFALYSLKYYRISSQMEKYNLQREGSGTKLFDDCLFFQGRRTTPFDTASLLHQLHAHA